MLAYSFVYPPVILAVLRICMSTGRVPVLRKNWLMACGHCLLRCTVRSAVFLAKKAYGTLKSKEL